MNLITKPLALLLLLGVTNLQAHEIWLVKTDNNQVNLFLGETGEPDAGDKISGLKNTKIFTDTAANSLPIAQHPTHWSANVTQNGDVRAVVDDLWQPWDMEKIPAWQFWRTSKQQAGKLFAKAGRSETESKTEFEFVPVAAQSNNFTLTYQGTPVIEQPVVVLTPNKTQIKLTTNEQGQITVLTDSTGLYVMSSDYPVDGKTIIAGHDVDSTYNIASISFWVN